MQDFDNFFWFDNFVLFFLVLSFVLNVIFGIVSANIAFNKNRNPWGWFFIGFFLSILGVAIIAVASKIEVDTESPTPHRPSTNGNRSDYIDCPFCAERIKRNAILCRFCNSELTSKSFPASTNIDEQFQRKMWSKLFEITNNNAIRFASESDGKWQCICGQNNPDDVNSCQKCASEKGYILDNYSKESIAKMLSNNQGA